jgi:hypothetical protein
MGKFSHIAYLIQTNKEEELLEEVAGVAHQLGKTPQEVAQGFKDAHFNVRKNKDNPVFKNLNKKLNEIVKDGNK